MFVFNEDGEEMYPGKFYIFFVLYGVVHILAAIFPFLERLTVYTQ